MVQQNLQTQTSEAELHSLQNQWQQVTRQKMKHVGAFLSILECFNKSTFFNVVRVSW